MKTYWQRIPGQTPFGVFTNLYPTPLCRIDRANGAYFCLHLGSFRLSIYL